MRKFLVLFAVLGAMPAFGQTLAQRRKLGDWNKELQSNEQWLEKKCGTKIRIAMEGSWATSGFLEANTDAGGYCADVASAVSGLCERDDVSKDAIAKQVKMIVCRPGKEKEQVFSLEGANFVGKVGLNAPNLTEHARKWLENNLK